MVEITSKIIKTDVTCVKCFQNYILAGIGGNVHVFYKTGKLLQIYPVFEGEKIHGIVANSMNKLAIYGANLLKIVEFDFITSQIVNDVVKRRCADWIFALEWLNADTQIATIFAQNYVSLWCSSDLKLAQNVGCTERCTLYSATLVNDTWTNLYALSGTVFGQILIWKPADCTYFSPVLWRLQGHDGAIFSIVYDKLSNTIATTSDDRTVRLWAVSAGLFQHETCRDNNSSAITLAHTMYGHLARVFRCKIIKDYIVTAGEDSFVHIWNFAGQLVRKFETHQGGCVWALDYCDVADLIVTGGGDTGLSVFPLNLDNAVKLLPTVESETPRTLKLTAGNNVVLVTDTGLMKYYKNNAKTWTEICLHEDLTSYAILSLSVCRRLIALAGLRGTIHIYRESDNGLTKLCSVAKPSGNRIFSLHWLQADKFLTSTTDGIMHLWHLQQVDRKYSVECSRHFILPPCKERWATSAVLCFKNNLVVGDRKGNIHLYSLDTVDVLQTVKKAHCHLGVTSLHYTANELTSLGRNGIKNTYNLNSSGILSQSSNDKLPFSWLASIIKQDNATILVGFSGSKFILFNLKSRRIVLELNCGGGHRSWDILINAASDLLHLVFIKEKQLNAYESNWSKILTSDFVQGYHTKEINCGALVNVNDDNKVLFISGSEDTTIRLSLIDNYTHFYSLDTLKSHLSSVRCINVCPLDSGEYLIFSGGGRAQIILQKLRINVEKGAFSSVECHLLDSYYKELDANEAETRVMDLTSIKLATNILLIAACSDGTLKCYCVNLVSASRLTFICNITYKTKCIIKIANLDVCRRNIVVSMATDGRLVFWDVTDLCEHIEDTQFVENIQLTPIYSLHVHQSGINCFHYKRCSDEKYIFATGGDDNAVVLNVVQFQITDQLSIMSSAKWTHTQAHGAQITGVFLHENYFITSSVDQHLSVFKYQLVEDKLKCELLKQYCSPVSDILGMTHLVTNKTVLYACVFGKGVELCKLTNFKL